MDTTFEKLIAPLKLFLEQQGTEIDIETGSRKLFFADFSRILIYAFTMGIPSLRQLVTELETNDNCKKLGLNTFAFSTLKDGFTRFPSKFFEKMYQEVIKNSSWLRIDAIDELGIFRLVDGSVFPTLISMDWAVYKKTKNAIRLHLSFELNRMIPIDFTGLKANSSERSFLENILEQGITYIADRGYFSFSLAAKIGDAKAFFILRVKENLKIGQRVPLKITCSAEQTMPLCFKKLSDELVRFESDKKKRVYRLICFQVLESQFCICTNRLDLTTLQIIILYAYRWQIELFFKFIKRSLNGISLFNHTENGVNVQFCILMIVAILELRLKQFAIGVLESNQDSKNLDSIKSIKNIEQIPTHSGYRPDLWIEALTKRLQKYWKIGCQWILKFRNAISKPFDFQIIKQLGST